MKKLLVGITGGIGAGKSAVAALYARMGYPVFSADELAREVVEPGEPAFDEILALFGPDAHGSDGLLNRAWLREKIAHNPDLRLKLEAITHPRIQERFKELAAEARGNVVFYEAPLLFEAKSETHLDAVITVHAPDEVRINRVMKRDGGSRELAEKILASQMPQDEKMKRADFLIENNGSESVLKTTAFAVLTEVRKKIGVKPPIPKKYFLAGGVIAAAIILAWGLALSWNDPTVFPPSEPEFRTNAKKILKNAQKEKNAGRDPFAGNKAFECVGCLHYIFASQLDCAGEGKIEFFTAGESALAEDLREMLPTLHQGLEALAFPCKEKGFNLFAVGMSDPHAPLDILTVDEEGGVRVWEDGVGNSPR